MTPLLAEKPKVLLETFLKEYAAVSGIDIERAKKLIASALLYYNNKETDGTVYQEFLEGEWYRGLEGGKVDYSCYNDEYYFTDLWVCWSMYSRGYLRALTHPKSLDEHQSVFDYLGKISSVVDLGCGMGYTTAALKQIFPAASVYGTNLSDTRQYAFCQAMSKTHHFDVIPDVAIIGKDIDLGAIDLVFASEYFEHFEHASQHITYIVDNIHPKFLYIANSFNTKSVGHFKVYKDLDGKDLDQSKASKDFNNTLAALGYKRVKTKLWNNKPTLWERV